MLVARNQSSGKYFIVIEHLTDGRLLCVNPENKIRPLSENLFDEIVDENKDKLISDGHITNIQIKKLEDYKADRRDEEIDSIKMEFEDMPHWQQQDLLRELQKLL